MAFSVGQQLTSLKAEPPEQSCIEPATPLGMQTMEQSTPQPIITRNTHAQSMPRAEEYPEICKSISVVTTCIV